MPAVITANVTAASVSEVRPRLSVSVVNAKGNATASVAAADVDYIELALGASLDTTGRFKFVAEIVVMLDALRLSTSKRLSDALAPVDATRLTPGKTLRDTASPADAIASKQTVKALADSTGTSERVVRDVAKALADSFATSDQPYKTAGKALADSFGLTDAQRLSVQKAIADSVSLSETFYAVLIFIRNLSDPASVSDAVRLSVVKAPFAESVAPSDASFTLFTKVLADGVAIDDGTSVGDGSTYYLTKLFNNIVGASDASFRQMQKSATDSVGTSEAGLVVAQNYCDITYFAEDYVGTSSNF